MLGIFKLFLIILTNPLEPLTVTTIDFTTIELHCNSGKFYIAPDDGYIDNIINNENEYQIIISLDTLGKVVYSGLSSVNRKKGERIRKGDVVGTDEKITENTGFILMLYNNLNIYPQIKSNSLIFETLPGTPVYSIYDSISFGYGYDEFKGIYNIFNLYNTDINITYCYLMAVSKVNNFVKQGEKIAFSGNTGISSEPQITLQINRSSLNDIKVIYWKPPIKKNAKTSEDSNMNDNDPFSLDMSLSIMPNWY